jgi:hypothetical protein
MRKLQCLLALLTFAVPLFAASPFVGTWKLNTAKTKYTKGSPLRNAILVIEEQGGNLKTTASGTTSDGSPISVEFTVPIKGGTGTVQAGEFNGVTSKLVSPSVRENTYLKDGKEWRSRSMVLSGDGKTLTSRVRRLGTAGPPIDGTDVFEKQ